MPYSYVKERNSRRELDEDRDPSCADDLQEKAPPAPPRVFPKSRTADPDGPWGLAQFFSDKLSGGDLALRLDLAQTKRLAGLISALLSDCSLSPERVRAMIELYASQVRGKEVASHVGYFWHLRASLITRTAPATSDYSSWTAPVVGKSVEWAW